MDKYEKTALQAIGKAIDIAVKERGLSLRKLEILSGVSRTIIYKVIRGENYEIISIIRIMRILQIHLELSLMDEENNVLAMGGHKPSRN